MRYLVLSILALVVLGGAINFGFDRENFSLPAFLYSKNIAESSAASKGGADKYQEKFSEAQSLQAASNPLTQYKPIPGRNGRNALDEIYTGGFPINEASFLATRRILRLGVSADEKVALARILGKLFQPDNATGHNAEILSELKILANEFDKEVARMAAISYARTGYQAGVESLLETAYSRGALSTDDYYGELAHMSPVFPANSQLESLEKILNAKNSYAKEIIADGIASKSILTNEYSPSAQAKIQEILKESEPIFTSATSVLPLTDAIRYSNWLNASAALESVRTGVSADEIVLRKLEEPGIDARKIMGYLLSPQALTLLLNTQKDPRFEGLIESINRYSKQYPESPSIQMGSQEIAARMNRSVVRVR